MFLAIYDIFIALLVSLLLELRPQVDNDKQFVQE